MRRSLICLTALTTLAALLQRVPAEGACCYFSALGQDVNQPAQKAFITWHPQEQIETFTVQPRFEGNARDFGMVIPTPARPRLYEMPREFFNELAVFTILKPTPRGKFSTALAVVGGGMGGFGGGGMAGLAPRPQSVVVLESGLVGSLDYKIVSAERASDLFQWLRDQRYNYQGDEATLEFYIRQKWFFTVMKIDPLQQKQRADGTYSGTISPTQFAFSTSRLVYPLQITRLSVKDSTEALFYVQAPYKVDLPRPSSYQLSWVPMWSQAMGMVLPGKLTEQEEAWQRTVKAAEPDLKLIGDDASRRVPGWQPARLEWAKRLDERDMAFLDRKLPFDRKADRKAVEQLNLLRGHLRKGHWLTKLRKTFRQAEMTADLEFVPATLQGQRDEMEYTYAYPTSPP